LPGNVPENPGHIKPILNHLLSGLGLYGLTCYIIFIMSLTLSFGEALFDCFIDRRRLGGAPLNFAWNLRQFGLPVAMVSAVGRDEHGAEIQRFLERAGIDRTWLVERDEPTGTVDVRLAQGEPDFTINENAAWDYIELLRTPETPDMLYFGAVAQRTPQNRQTLGRLFDLNPRRLFFDINLRQRYYTEEIVLEGLRRATMVKLNTSEWNVVRHMIRLEKPEDLLEACDLDMVALTAGSDEAALYTRQGVFRRQPPKVTVVDTVGAGDAFSAALAAGALLGVDAPLILEIACAAGAVVASHAGAHVRLPDKVRCAFDRPGSAVKPS
jgi:fructokinase